MPIRFSRRQLLCGVSTLTLIPPFSDRTLGQTAASFGGNPNVTITAIDVSGGIVASRVSGEVQTPAFIQVSASAIKAAGTDWPYEDLEFSWNFGDASGTEIFLNPVTGTKMNANDGQTGPEAAYVYRKPGPYTITLTIRGKNGDTYTRGEATSRFVVHAFRPSGGEYYFDELNGNDSFSGLHPTHNATPPGNTNGPKRNLTALKTLMGSHKAIHLARGSHWRFSEGGNYIPPISNLTALRIDAYGNGPDPIVECDSGSQSPISAGNGPGGTSAPHPSSDVVISNIRFLVSGASTAKRVISLAGNNSGLAGGDGSYRDFYLDNCVADSSTLTTVASQLSFGANAYGFHPTRAGVWNCRFIAALTATGGGNHQGISASWREWFFMVGGSIAGAGSVSGRDHHIYPIVKDHVLYRWIDFGPTSSTNPRVYCVNTDWNNNAWIQFSECTISNGAGAAGTLLLVGGKPAVGGQTFFVPGLVIQGAGVTPGTRIVSLATGGGGAGSVWNVDRPSLVSTPGPIGTAFALQYCDYYVYDGCRFAHTEYAHDADDANNDPAFVQWRNQVVQNCAFDSLTKGGVYAVALLSYTVRDCLVWGITGGNWMALGTNVAIINDAMALKFYRNKIYEANKGVISIANTVAPLGASVPFQFTDNIIHDTRTDARILGVKPADMKKCVIDRNQYYAPNSSGGPKFNGGEAIVTFSQWQANFDAHGKIANPNWIDPAHGNFSVPAP